ncbi:radical SAM family heme chaperone HemW [Alloalcanivorax xenomutans]|uniref:radical SAM family heme chaperone HemW n=1 Tax=Alloalcanivorax xenomutans TaxID=1094342 RepID=UPI0029316145|nr:radical SAM family heme chaperone HemW [Alloalcanivorax xenomutans]WOA31705.1 radical SAM family heme chaperone HemW [Alloalcanivorax xenomutans]
MTPERPPLALYVHVPWCVRKCPYCDFNSHQRDTLPETQYLDALLADLDADQRWLEGELDRPVVSIFIGGGTPSLMSADFYRRLLDGLRQRLPMANDVEITLEANPGTVEAGRFEGFREAGINRLSIGVQSFDPGQLAALGRIHGPEEARRAVALARAAGFDNFNLDLMHALPGQTPAQALADLQAAIELSPAHLSWYELTIEPNTAFYRAPPTQPDEDTMADIEEQGFALLQRHGYERYEVSAFARPDRRCRHNLNYWRFGDYLAIGAGAHGKLTRRDGQRLRYQKTRQPEAYLRAPEQTRRSVSAIEDPLFEALLNALRLINGVPSCTLSQYCGVDQERIAVLLAPLRERGLLQPDPDRIVCTALGLRHLNTVLALIGESLSAS